MSAGEMGIAKNPMNGRLITAPTGNVAITLKPKKTKP